MMNVHPMLVHFPIALLTIYAILELLRIKPLTRWPSYFSVKATFAILGAAAAIPAVISGMLIGPQYAVGEQATAILSRHAIFGQLTFLTFLFIGIRYLMAVRGNGKARAFVDGRWSMVMAAVGLVLVTITGALGGGFVHGSSVDPMVRTVFRVFGL